MQKFSPLRDIPAFYTLQPGVEIREKQLGLWVNDFLLFYQNDVCFELNDKKSEQFFENAKLKRTASYELRREIINRLLKEDYLLKVNNDLYLIKQKVKDWFDEIISNLEGMAEGWKGIFFSSVNEILELVPKIRSKDVTPECLLVIMELIDPDEKRIWFQTDGINSPLIVFFTKTSNEAMKFLMSEILKKVPFWGRVVHKSDLPDILTSEKIIKRKVNKYFIDRIYRQELTFDNKELKEGEIVLIRDYRDSELLERVIEFYSSGGRIGGVVSFEELRKEINGNDYPWFNSGEWESNITSDMTNFTVDTKVAILDAKHIYISRKTFDTWFQDLTSVGPIHTPFGGVYTPNQLAVVFNETLKSVLKGVTGEMILKLLDSMRIKNFLKGKLPQVKDDSLLKPLWQIKTEELGLDPKYDHDELMVLFTVAVPTIKKLGLKIESEIMDLISKTENIQLPSKSGTKDKEYYKIKYGENIILKYQWDDIFKRWFLQSIEIFNPVLRNKFHNIKPILYDVLIGGQKVSILSELFPSKGISVDVTPAAMI